MNEKPVTLLTGFLGSGKTTFLNVLLKTRKDIKYAIIENEFGEEGIDSDLILRAEDDIVEMNNGCLCCSLNDNLYDILNELYKRREEFDELVIESTGIADPAGIAAPFYTHPAIGKTFPMARVVCLVDAQLVEDQLKETDECAKQIAFSDVLLINKCDAVSPAYLEELKEILRKVNPDAEIFSGSKPNYPLDEIFSVNRKKVLEQGGQHAHKDEVHQHRDHHVHEHHHHGDITSLSFRFKEPFDIDMFYNRMFVFLQLQAKDVFRVKGVLYAGDEYKYVFQSVGSNLSMERGVEWKEGEERLSRIVFIGKNLQPKGFEKMLRQVMI
ncbi:MAG: CobW family GTP-binding protein [Cytophagaceae bacterium]